MTPERLIEIAIADSPTDARIASLAADQTARETELNEARAAVQAAADADAELIRRQDAVNQRLVDVDRQVERSRPGVLQSALEAVDKASHGALAKLAIQRETALQETRLLKDCLTHLATSAAGLVCETTRARIALARASSAWYFAAGMVEITKLHAKLAPALQLDRSLTFTAGSDCRAAVFAARITEAEAQTIELTAELRKQEAIVAQFGGTK